MTNTPTAFPTSARASACRILRDVLERNLTLERLMAEPFLSALEPRDKQFCHLMVLTALRRLGQIDDLLARWLQKPLPANAMGVKAILRLGLVQLIWLKTPPHAAVNSMVELTGELGFEHHKGLVNAVLKRASREADAALAQQDEARLNLPDWLWQSWCAAYGEAQARAMASAQQSEPPLDLSVKADAPEWAEKLGGTLLPTGSVRLRQAGAVTALPGFGEGAWWVQDASSALPVKLLGDLKGKKVVDLCAAPGGKTVQMAALGAQVLAVDRSAERMKIVKANLARLGLSAECRIADARTLMLEKPAEAILLDAPCSATGTLRRHPEGLWHKQPGDVVRLQNIQARLLANAASLLTPGGTLVYCICSLQPEEAEVQIADFLRARPEMALSPIRPEELGGQAQFITPKGELRTLPSHWPELGGLDGFYAARLVKH